MVTFEGEQVVGVTAINTTPVFEDIYGVQGGPYNPAAAGERGFMKASDAALADGSTVYIQLDYTPLFIEQNT